MSIEVRRTQAGLFLLLRRLRAPLIVLIVVYAVAVFGFTLVPGVDPDGRPWRMSFLHAFYFVSFLGTTIGLGEIPYPFSDAQRLWAVASIYATVVAWLYSIGSMLSTLQDPLFRRIMLENRFANAVRGIREPFVVLCGYDDAGRLVARELTEEGIGVVIVDRDPARVESVEIDRLPAAVPALQANAVVPATLLSAGVTHPACIATLALTGDDATNLSVSLNAKILAPQRPVICVAHHHEHQAAMARVGTEHLINPHDTFAERLAQSILKPSLHVIYESLTTQTSTPMATPPAFPRGRWLICGYGRFGRTVHRHLEQIGIVVTVVDEQNVSDKGTDYVSGNMIDATTLRRARLGEAAGIVICTPNDTTNLAVAMLARELNPSLFRVVRLSNRRNTPLFRALEADIITLSGYIVAAEVLRIIRAPQLSYFLRLARHQDERWTAQLLERMRERIGAEIAETWSITIDEASAPAFAAARARGQRVTVGELMRAPDNRELCLGAVPLLLQREDGKSLLPADDEELLLGDRLLLCGREITRGRLRWSLSDQRVLRYLTGSPQRA
ncbi:MAG: hypothetical protein CALGDGBN_02722 [Pseudomonadales bacterium]|nr:hypothetical protein [Pseudomonadales bacterium]